MIPEIGVMIGAYVVVRMLALLSEPFTSTPTRRVWLAVQGFAKIGAVVTIVVAILVMADLVMRGTGDLNMPRLE